MMRSRWLPLSLAVLIVLASIFVPRYDALYFESPHVMSVTSAQAFLSAIAAGGITLTAIVFSISLLVLQFTVASYSPRLAPILIRDPVMVLSLLTFIATFGFALGTLAVTDERGRGIVPHYSVAVVTVLLALSMALLGRLIQRVGRLQIYNVLELLARYGRPLIQRRAIAADEPTTPETLPAVPSRSIRYSGPLVYVTGVYYDRFERLGSGARVEPACRVNDPLAFGTTIAFVYGDATAFGELEVMKGYAVGNERSVRADLPYVFRLLVDTAVRALSPAVNDPATAVETLDVIEELMCRLSQRRLDRGETWQGYLNLAFDEIYAAGTDQETVCRRLRAALETIAGTCTSEARNAQTAAYLSRITATTADRQGIGVFAEEGI